MLKNKFENIFKEFMEFRILNKIHDFISRNKTQVDLKQRTYTMY